MNNNNKTRFMTWALASVMFITGVCIGTFFVHTPSDKPTASDTDLLHEKQYPVVGVNFELHDTLTDRTLLEFDPRNYCLIMAVNTADEGQEQKLEEVHVRLDNVRVSLTEPGYTPTSTLARNEKCLIVTNGPEFSYMCSEKNFEGFNENMIKFCLAYLFYTDEDVAGELMSQSNSQVSSSLQ